MALNDDEAVALLREMRDLLRPIAHHYQAEYTDWQAQQRRALESEVKALVDASPSRRRAWQLADGTRTQREISKQTPLDEGSTSKFFKQLRALGAVQGEQPKRVMEV